MKNRKRLGVLLLALALVLAAPVLAAGAVWLDGRRFSGSASESAVTNWVNGLGLEPSPAA